VSHDEEDVPACTSDGYKIIRPQIIPFISYPFEWSFSQLKAATLATLAIQEHALYHGMILKDASAYNIQFIGCKPVLIDTLSFEIYQEGSPWSAYRQFCQHFLAPLALMSHNDIRLQQLLRVYIDGVPLDLASRLLPLKTKFMFSLYSHIHLHARSQKKYANTAVRAQNAKMSLFSLRALIDSLESAVRRITWKPQGSAWADYYEDTNYSDAAFECKKELVAAMLDTVQPETVWDLGANDGTFSRIAASRGIRTIAFDIDPAAVEKNYLTCLRNNEFSVLPLLSDITNPSGGIGWANEERMSLKERGPADAVLALALIHHLAISNNVPFVKIAEFLSTVCKHLIIEFVPKSDSQVQRLLRNREDIFTRYDREHFEQDFNQKFIIHRCEPIAGSERFLYLMEKRGADGIEK